MSSQARKIAYEISNGIRPKQFIGHKSFEVLQMELFSLKNRYNPDTMSSFELEHWNKNLDCTIQGILELPKEQRSELYKTVDDMLNP